MIQSTDFYPTLLNQLNIPLPKEYVFDGVDITPVLNGGTLDRKEIITTVIEHPEPLAPLGAKGVGEPPCISVTPAIAAAIRDALRQADRPYQIDRVPVRPTDIVGL